MSFRIKIISIMTFSIRTLIVPIKTLIVMPLDIITIGITIRNVTLSIMTLYNLI
jgi:hypothetical protein